MDYRIIRECIYGQEGQVVPSTIWFNATPRERQLYFRVRYDDPSVDWDTTLWYNSTVQDDSGED